MDLNNFCVCALLNVDFRRPKKAPGKRLAPLAKRSTCSKSILKDNMISA